MANTARGEALVNPSRLRASTMRQLRALPLMLATAQAAGGFRPRRHDKQSEVLRRLIDREFQAVRRRLRRLQEQRPEYSSEIRSVLEDTKRTPKPKAPPPPADADFDQFSIDTPEDLIRREQLPLPDDTDKNDNAD